MEIIKPGINLDFIGKRRIAYTISGAMFLLTLILLILRGGLNYGVDFTGGIVIQVKLEQSQSPSEIREAMKGTPLEECIIQEYGEKRQAEYLIRLTNPEAQIAGMGEKAREALSERFGQGVDIRQVEMVGPQVGKDLREKALFAIFYSILFMAVYISGRFEMKWLVALIMALSLILVTYLASLFGAGVTWLIFIAMIVTLGLCWFLRLRYALGAIIAMIHDVAFTLGALLLTNKEISLGIIAALLTIVGYSINDTIVVFDRIRENLGKIKKQSFESIMNKSVNETLSRTILTGTCTLVVLVALFFLGGTVIHDFAFALIVGIIVGTYSSIYVASPILLLWEDNPFKKSKGAKS